MLSKLLFHKQYEHNSFLISKNSHQPAKMKTHALLFPPRKLQPMCFHPGLKTHGFCLHVITKSLPYHFHIIWILSAARITTAGKFFFPSCLDPGLMTLLHSCISLAYHLHIIVRTDLVKRREFYHLKGEIYIWNTEHLK